jgi:flagellar basal-body rod modification protein FlgD
MATSPISLGSLFAASTQSAKSTKAQTTSATTSSTTSSDGLTGTTTGTTFLNLLVKELQNQDPTAPMDSTAMVGQMISLNSLDQLISINQVLSTATGSKASTSTGHIVGATGTGTSGSTASASAAQAAERTALLSDSQSAGAIQNASQNALDPNKALDLSNINFANGAK